jgi:hypothetical protein
MKNLLLALSAMAALAVPTASFAATYHYVDTSGSVRTVEASSAQAAFNSATDRAANSGVTLDTGVLDSGDSVSGTANGDLYHYVDMTGVVRSVNAVSADAALSAAAPTIAVHSGVAVDTGTLDDGVPVTAQ